MALHIFGLTRLDGTGYTRTRRRPRRHSANSARGGDWRRIIFANRVAIATTSPLLSLPAIPAGVRSTASWSPHGLEPPGLRQLNTSSGDAGHRGSYRRPVRRQWRHAGPPRPLGSTRKNYYRDEARRGRACVGGDAVCDSWLRQRFGVHHTAPSDRRLRGPSRHRLGSAPHTSADRPAAAAPRPRRRRIRRDARDRGRRRKVVTAGDPPAGNGAGVATPVRGRRLPRVAGACDRHRRLTKDRMG